ncbi:MAG TPA: glycoside hydrolase family 172 protein [Thermoguttaceae bacterium]|nr:glycoside hydrolase family 172 protein [Thermoguttaceae bacterium]
MLTNNGATRWGMFACLAFVLTMTAASVSLAQGLDKLTRWEEGRSRRVGSNAWNPKDKFDIANNLDRPDRIEPGETYVMADLKGPGVITHIWLTFLQEPHFWVTDGAADPQEMLLRIYWDGREKPDVECPVGDFFANCFGRRMAVVSLPVVVEDADSYNCFWHMPFRKSARIEIVNQSKKPIRKLYNNVDWIQKKSLPENTMYFCAQYNQQYPTKPGEDYVVLDAEGRGYYVGTVLAVRTRSPSWFGEGDEMIYIDGEEQPSIRGTGTEDYFLSAWGLKENSTPYFGVPYLNQDSDSRIIGQMTCSYRWHLQDPLVFSKGIKVTFETFGWMSPDENKEHAPHMWNPREDDYSSVAFWYQMGPTKKFTTVPSAEERKLPSIDRVTVWGKDALAAKSHGPGRAALETGADYLKSGGQLAFQPTNVKDGWVDYTFEVKEKEPLRLLVELTRGPSAGIYQVWLNGTKVGNPLDLYEPKPGLWEFHIMDFWPEAGKYQLRLQCVGKNKKSEGINIGVNSVRLRERRPRVKAFGYDKDKDWRTDQVLYE